MKSENREICRDIVLSYVETVVKKLGRFLKSWHVRCLQIEESPKKFQRVVKDSLRLGVKVTTELRFDFKTLYIGNIHHRLLHVKFWLILEYFW